MNKQAPTLKLEIQRRIMLGLPLADLPLDLRGFSVSEKRSILYLLGKYSEDPEQRRICEAKRKELEI